MRTDVVLTADDPDFRLSSGENMTKADSTSHPRMRHADTPESLKKIIVNSDLNAKRSDLWHSGAGETVCKPTLAAIANAIFETSGVRLRRVPFRPARVLTALRAAKSVGPVAEEEWSPAVGSSD